MVAKEITGSRPPGRLRTIRVGISNLFMTHLMQVNGLLSHTYKRWTWFSLHIRSGLSRVELDLYDVSLSIQDGRDSTLNIFDSTEQTLRDIDSQVAEVHSAVDNGSTHIRGSITTIQRDVGVILSIVKPDGPSTSNTSHGSGQPLQEPSVPTATFVMRSMSKPRGSLARCDAGCVCQCYKQGSPNTRRWLRPFLGTLFLGYCGSPVGTTSCDAPRCRKRGLLHLEVMYIFPRWMLQYSLHATLQKSLAAGLDRA
jgi:hypothetical protein